jgi:16S rRNA (guanine(1405)-N(7))-methyltransferase
MPMPDLEAVVSAVASSKKYRAICEDTIRRIARRELAHHGSVKAATKATKRRLHQIYGAFEQDLDYEAAYRGLESAYGTGSAARIQEACRQILDQHSSTRERLPILDRFYPAILSVTGQPAAILDLGCGLNPLALPWMDLPAAARYIALDIDAARIAFLNRYLALAGLESLARCQDLLAHPPDDLADVAFLLKMSPSLERQEPGATPRLIERLRAPSIVVSFAVKSLGGREKGMVEHYQRQFSEWIEERGWPVDELVFETELVFVVKKQRIGRIGGSSVPRGRNEGNP